MKECPVQKIKFYGQLTPVDHACHNCPNRAPDPSVQRLVEAARDAFEHGTPVDVTAQAAHEMLGLVLKEWEGK